MGSDEAAGKLACTKVVIQYRNGNQCPYESLWLEKDLLTCLLTQWRIQGRWCDRPLPLWSDRELFDNLCTVFVSFVLRLNHKIRVSSLLITVTFLREPIPFHHTTPPSTPTVPRRLSAEILNTPLYSPIYLSGMYFVIILTVSQIQTLQLPSLS